MITVAQNQCESDGYLWRRIAAEADVALEWVDTAVVGADDVVAGRVVPMPCR